MKTVLQLNTSIFSNVGESTNLTNEFIENFRKENTDTKLISRNLADNPVPHLTGQRFQAFLTKAEDRSLEQQEVVDYSDNLIDEIRQADIIVIGLPMYNFGIPSTLKSYFDHIARAGVTFKYTESGPVGLLLNKKVYVLATRGGIYAGTPLDTQTSYVKDFLNFLGISDVEFIYAEGLAMGVENKETAISKAKSAIRSLTDEKLAA